MKRLDETRIMRTGKKQKPRLLSPISSYESAVGVISAGVDEIYCGVRIPGIKYLGISNQPSWCSLSNDRELEKVVNYAHVHGVDTIVTTEFPFMARVIEKDIRRHIRSCVDKGADAIIASDVGVLLLIKEMDIDIPVYASTYLASMNYEAVDFLRKLDVKRVILERHLTINEIQDIVHKSKDVEIVIFIHGSGC
jgi:putative protease